MENQGSCYLFMDTEIKSYRAGAALCEKSVCVCVCVCVRERERERERENFVCARVYMCVSACARACGLASVLAVCGCMRLSVF